MYLRFINYGSNVVSNGKGCSSVFDRVPVALGDDIGHRDLLATFCALIFNITLYIQQFKPIDDMLVHGRNGYTTHNLYACRIHKTTIHPIY
ncbi:hypothetical protein CUMW_021620 [Citrus unshiu]|nr:hypothetical protein CUMW_021620 [Citrus unshiu]